MATDIVAGLRILRGIGGESTFGRNYGHQSQVTREAGVAAGIWQAAIEAVGVLMSGCFLVLLMYAGTRAVDAGELTVGELVSFLGYGLFMVGPIRTFFEFAQKLTRALVSAQKAVAVLELTPPWHEPAAPVSLPHDGDLVDESSGFVAHPGQLTVVVSAVPESSAALADRLGRWFTVEEDPPPLAGADRPSVGASCPAPSVSRGGSCWPPGMPRAPPGRGASPTAASTSARVPLDEVRRAILVSDTNSQLFAGTLQDAVDPHGVLTREQAEQALRVGGRRGRLRRAARRVGR